MVGEEFAVEWEVLQLTISTHVLLVVLCVPANAVMVSGLLLLLHTSRAAPQLVFLKINPLDLKTITFSGQMWHFRINQ